MPHRSQRDRFDRVLGRLADEGWEFVDADRFAADTDTGGLLSVPADVADHFDADGVLVRDVAISLRGAVAAMVQSTFAREGLVASVPVETDEDDLLDLDVDELQRRYDAAMEALGSSAHGTGKPADEVVTCLATDQSSDLCRIARAFDRLAEHGYVAEPAIWPTTSGAWQRVHELAGPGELPGAVFWNTQSHESSFDARGDLTEELPLQWAGDRDLIAGALAETGLEVESPEDDATVFFLRPTTQR